MPEIVRSALVEHSAARMFALVNDIAATAPGLARHLSRNAENALVPPHHIDMALRDGPFKRLHGRWQFHALDESACKVTLTLDFEPQTRLLGPALALGMQGLADRMVDDFVREADRGGQAA